jgi:hypothetical protein
MPEDRLELNARENGALRNKELKWELNLQSLRLLTFAVKISNVFLTQLLLVLAKQLGGRFI